jgi:hypothetical protein
VGGRRRGEEGRGGEERGGGRRGEERVGGGRGERGERLLCERGNEVGEEQEDYAEMEKGESPGNGKV